MDFEWDEAKNAINREKHGVAFEVMPALTGAMLAFASTTAGTMENSVCWPMVQLAKADFMLSLSP